MPLAKKTSKNQITLPKKVVEQFPDIDYFDVRVGEGAIVLYPVDVDNADRVREKLDALGIDEQDIRNAIRWARSKDD
ncbi:MAG: AbrB/MazE/SpoVT family DNA-binding domain-containing protein [Acidobacteriota bacterium]|nr:MAG: AbrB/MazE/SpoVT family DNA-binding domain-containing protein [Acidobacteriota bacterium]